MTLTSICSCHYCFGFSTHNYYDDDDDDDNNDDVVKNLSENIFVMSKLVKQKH